MGSLIRRGMFATTRSATSQPLTAQRFNLRQPNYRPYRTSDLLPYPLGLRLPAGMACPGFTWVVNLFSTSSFFLWERFRCEQRN